MNCKEWIDKKFSSTNMKGMEDRTVHGEMEAIYFQNRLFSEYFIVSFSELFFANPHFLCVNYIVTLCSDE